MGGERDDTQSVRGPLPSPLDPAFEFTNITSLSRVAVVCPHKSFLPENSHDKPKDIYLPQKGRERRS